jgi:hypothetical protein
MPAIAKLVTLSQAKAQLGITLPAGDPSDEFIQDKLNEAEETILNYLKGANGLAVTWTDPTTAPGDVTAAIKLLLVDLHEWRGDDEEKDAVLWVSIANLLVRYRDPALA